MPVAGRGGGRFRVEASCSDTAGVGRKSMDEAHGANRPGRLGICAPDPSRAASGHAGAMQRASIAAAAENCGNHLSGGEGQRGAVGNISGSAWRLGKGPGALLGEEGLWHQAERAWGGRGGNGLHECERGGQTLGTARRERCGISGGAPALSKRTSNVECLDVTPSFQFLQFHESRHYRNLDKLAFWDKVPG